MDPAIIENLRFQSEQPHRQERATETRRKILDTAAECFAYKGFSGASTHDIAARAGVNQGLITYHFKSKENLWNEVIDELFGEFRNELANRMHELREVDEAIFFKLIIRHYLRSAAKRPEIIRLMFEQGKQPDEHLKRVVDRHIKPIYDALCHFIESGQKQGAIRPGPVNSIYYIFLTTASVFSIKDEAKWVTGEDVLSEAFIESHANCLINMLFVDEAQAA